MSSVGIALGHQVLQAVLLGATGEQGPALLGLLLGTEFEMLMWCMHAAPVTLKDSMGSSMACRNVCIFMLKSALQWKMVQQPSPRCGNVYEETGRRVSRYPWLWMSLLKVGNNCFFY